MVIVMDFSQSYFNLVNWSIYLGHRKGYNSESPLRRINKHESSEYVNGIILVLDKSGDFL